MKSDWQNFRPQLDHFIGQDTTHGIAQDIFLYASMIGLICRKAQCKLDDPVIVKRVAQFNSEMTGQCAISDKVLWVSRVMESPPAFYSGRQPEFAERLVHLPDLFIDLKLRGVQPSRSHRPRCRLSSTHVIKKRFQY